MVEQRDRITLASRQEEGSCAATDSLCLKMALESYGIEASIEGRSCINVALTMQLHRCPVAY